jgi:hypothetical protein
LIKKLEELRMKTIKIEEIYSTIAVAPAEKKIETIDKCKPVM